MRPFRDRTVRHSYGCNMAKPDESAPDAAGPNPSRTHGEEPDASASTDQSASRATTGPVSSLLFRY